MKFKTPEGAKHIARALLSSAYVAQDTHKLYYALANYGEHPGVTRAEDDDCVRRLLRALEKVGLITVRHKEWQTTAAGWVWHYLTAHGAFDIDAVLDKEPTFERWSRELVLTGVSVLVQHGLFSPASNPLESLHENV